MLLDALQQHGKFACCCASSKLEDVFRQLHTGDISIVELEMIRRAQDSVKLLSEAANEENNGRPPPSTDAQWKLSLTERLQEYNEFQKQNSFLLHLCQKVPTQVLGMK